MFTRSQTRKAKSADDPGELRGTSSTSSASKAARIKAAEASHKKKLAEIDLQEVEAAAAAAAAAARRKVAEAAHEATIAELEMDDIVSARSEISSARSNRTANWVAKSDFAVDVAAPEADTFPRGQSMTAVLTHDASEANHVCDTTLSTPKADAVAEVYLPPRRLAKDDSPPQPLATGNCTIHPVSDIQKLTNAITSLASSSQKTKPYVELPCFDGNLSSWLLFKRTFDETKPHLSASENLARLRIALLGEAKEAVFSLLLCSTDPETVMRSLEARFARPKRLVLNELALIRNLPKVGADLNSLATFASKVKNCVSVVSLLNHSPYIHSPELIDVLVSKLSPLMQNKWCDYAAERCVPERPQIDVFARFLEVEANKQAQFGPCGVFNSSLHPEKPKTAVVQQSAQAQRTYHAPFRSAQAHHTIAPSSTYSTTPLTMPESVNTSSSTCLYCSANDHSIKACSMFMALKVADRITWVGNNKICKICLRKGKHYYKQCRAKACDVEGCNEMHNKILHLQKTSSFSFQPNINNVMSSATQVPITSLVKSDTLIAEKEKPNINSSKENLILAKEIPPCNEIADTAYSCAPEKENGILLKVLPVILSGPSGQVDTFALLDDGSTVTLLDSELAQKIGVSGAAEAIRIETIAGIKVSSSVKLFDFMVRGKYRREQFTIHRARAVPDLKLRPQEVTIADTSFPHLRDISPELVFSKATPKVLIGTSDWHLLVSYENRTGTLPQPAAINTALGWVLFGQAPLSSSVHTVNNCFINNSTTIDNELENLIRNYYRLDSIGIKHDEKVNSEDDRAKKILKLTTRRLGNGRFEVGLPWREDEPSIPDSYNLALSRFQSLQKRFNKDGEYAKLYKANIEAYLEKGYAEECVDSHSHASSSSRRWYLPHFGVTNPNKPGKLRIVHDASAKTAGVSLNSLILQGPDELQSLLGILMRFREGQIALNGDIREMFPQIKIREEDRDCQRYLWQSAQGDVKEFRMSSLIFGASASPFTAMYVKNRNAIDFQDQYPEAIQSIMRDHYMDDFLGSCDDLDSAVRLAADILHVHAQCGFEMRSWVSNKSDALRLIPSHLHKEDPGEVDLNFCETLAQSDVRVLGMHWDPLADTFNFKIEIDVPPRIRLTKRQVLRDLMSIYDPLGLLQPKITKGKILFQRTWRLVNSWDAVLPPAECVLWEEWYHEITEAQIPRAYKYVSRYVTLELHTFTDASELAYACVAYWRFSFEDGTCHLALIASKSRVAPLKPVSVPRLELQAALLGVRLAQTISSEHRLRASRRVFWCDSKTVLAWIRSDARAYKPFVSFRLGEISEYTQVDEWRWVPTASNVADDATRSNSVNLARWWQGPSFLNSREEDWPKEADQPISPEYNVELRSKVGTAIINCISLFSADKYSDWRRLLRVIARCYLYVRILKEKDSREAVTFCSGNLRPLLALDIRKAEGYLLRQAQKESFSEDLKNTRKSRLRKYNPILDEDGLLRAHGRINLAPGVPQEMREPVILDGRHPTVKLLISRYHVWAMHGHNETVVNELRQKYLILHLRPTVRAIAAKCHLCRLRRARPTVPPTGDLPIVRLQHHHRPFSFTGLDYFGPLEVTVKRSREKRYVALFTCLVTRAVHLEVVGSLTAGSAIMALRRLIARRGCPVKILSDNGTAFTGASRLLKEAWTAINHAQILDFAASNNIEWEFIPPASPFMGGAWKRLVRSVKRALSVTLKERAPKEEILITLLAEAESVINSRPLTHVPIAHEDEPALTPNHFLLGFASCLPSPPTSEADLIGRQEWKKALHLADIFWARWVKEYLPNLLPRGPASEGHRNLLEGDLVLICDGNLPRGLWPRGRVVKVYPGRDGVVRVADVATRAGVLRRPARKLFKLNLSP